MKQWKKQTIGLLLLLAVLPAAGCTVRRSPAAAEDPAETPVLPAAVPVAERRCSVPAETALPAGDTVTVSVAPIRLTDISGDRDLTPVLAAVRSVFHDPAIGEYRPECQPLGEDEANSFRLDLRRYINGCATDSLYRLTFTRGVCTQITDARRPFDEAAAASLPRTASAAELRQAKKAARADTQSRLQTAGYGQGYTIESQTAESWYWIGTNRNVVRVYTRVRRYLGLSGGQAQYAYMTFDYEYPLSPA